MDNFLLKGYNFKMKSKFLLLGLLGLVLVAFLSLPLVPTQAQGAIIPFGGVTMDVRICLNLVLLVIQRPVTGPDQLIFDPFSSRLYSYFKLTPGSSGKHILGIAGGPSVCRLVFRHVVAPKIIMIGTSE